MKTVQIYLPKKQLDALKETVKSGTWELEYRLVEELPDGIFVVDVLYGSLFELWNAAVETGIVMCSQNVKVSAL